MINMVKKCRLCEREVNFDKYTVLDDGTIICNECGDRISNAMGYYKLNNTDMTGKSVSMSGSASGNTANKVFPKPKQIKAELDRFVVGQEQAKKVLSVAAYNHFKRITLNKPGLQKSNVLMVGPTGSGKTYLMKTLARILEVPLAIVSATGLTESGYVGDDVTTILEALLAASNNDVERAERGIVFIDEIDKLAAGSSESKLKVGGKGVQQALLPIIEGSKVMVPIGGKGGVQHKIEVDTTNILFVCGGAFPDMEPMIKSRLSGTSTIGFSVGDATASDAPTENILTYTTNADLKAFGLIPEFLGRLPVLTTLEELSVDTLKKILFEPEDSIVKQFQTLFAYDGVELTFEDEVLTMLAEKAKENGTGARSLRNAMEELLLDLQFQVPDSGIRKLVITKEFAGDPASVMPVFA